MTSNRSVPPVWLMGLSNTTLGLSTGTIFFVMPQLLAAEHVAEARIAAITAVAMSANFGLSSFHPSWTCASVDAGMPPPLPGWRPFLSSPPS